ncbi:cytochrome c family protein [Hyphomicrobium sp. CS1BSMeth3]|uniref:cytochrome c family protein n=1 Tax=Hyphomicrobium sp. CS1BSMeth3 TaxID=1892844 RepID=UPI0009FA633C|nr:cytochrome c family protein [Hyphomicrobium sp. CS1BSMeth3]
MLCIIALLATLGFAAGGTGASDASKIVGPNACAECHKQESEAWQGSHHFKTFRDMPRKKEANEIAERMGVSRIRSEGICLGCHYTVQQKDNKKQPIAGISCESCHSAGDDWIRVHSQFSGKTEKTETKAEKEARLKLADSKGMIRPSSIYRLTKNCYGCHVVPQEDLVNKGGHSAGSAFEMVSWSQGEVRHNTWHSKGKQNVPANAARKRMLYLIGLGVELETALRAVGKSTVRRTYAFAMARRADRARKQLAVAAKAVPNVPEIAKLIEYGHAAGLKLNNERLLAAAADGVSKTLASISEKYDGSTMAGLDGLIPGTDKFKGKVREGGASN